MLNFFSFPNIATTTRSLLFLFLLALCLPAAAQAPAWQSARAVAVATAAATDNYSTVRATAVDAAGNVYIAGTFTNTVVMGGTALVSLGGFDVFVAKFNPVSSQFIWAQRAGGTGNDKATALTVIGTNIYMAGAFASSTANFGTTTLTNPGLGTADVFVAKLADAGSTSSFAWTQRAGGRGEDEATALSVSGTSVYVTGYFASTTAVFGLTTLTSAGSSDVFVAKLADSGSTGSFVWAQRAGGTGEDVAAALSVSGSSVYVAGDFASTTANFGATIVANPMPSINLGFLASLTDATLTATTAAAGPREPATLFPNPARHAATLRLPAGTAPALLVLTDALGRAVRRYPAPAGAEAALDLGGLPAGLYLLRGAGPAQRLVVE